MFFTEKSFQDVELLTHYFEVLEKVNQNKKYDKYYTLEEFLSNDNLKANFFMDIVERFIKKSEHDLDHNLNYQEKEKALIEIVKSKFDKSFVEKMFIETDSYIGHDMIHYLSSVNPFCQTIQDISLSPWQWYAEHLDKKIVEDVYYKMTEAPTPFNNDKFKVLPISIRNRTGISRLNYFKNEQGTYKRDYDVENLTYTYKKTENSWAAFHLDAKLGFIFYFKNKPCFIVSFNVDSDKNIFIHQIQGIYKNRAKYKIQNWETECVFYLKNLFNDYTLHIISGENASKIVYNDYDTPSFPEALRPSKELLNKIKEGYDSLFSEFSNKIKKSSIYYRPLNF